VKRMVSAFIALMLLFTAPTLAQQTDMLEKAKAYMANGEYDKALASYELAQRAQPDSEEAYLGMAMLYTHLKKYDEALAVLDVALDIIPLSPGLWHAKCQVYILMEDVAAFEKSKVYAEVCGVDFTPDAVPIAMLYAGADLAKKAIEYFALADVGSLNDVQKKAYRRALAQTGRRDQAEALGLAAATRRDARLDQAFNADALILEETTWPTITADDFDFPDAMWQALETDIPAAPHAELAAVLSANPEIIVFSVSPDGNSALLTMNGTAVGYYESKYRVLYPSRSKGVEDIYQNLDKYSKGIGHILRISDGVIYSRDGRYAAVYSTRLSLMNAQFFLDPIILDLSTGEMVLTATYANKRREDNAGVVTTACFSADGRYFYYMLIGNTTEDYNALYRYNLAAETTELCCTIPYYAYYPQLSEMSDGSLIVLEDTPRANEHTGILQITPDGGQWRVAKHPFSLPMRHWYVQRLDYSANTGYALMAIRPDRGFAFMAVQPDDGYIGLNCYLAIRKDSNAVDVLTENDIIAALDKATRVESGIDAALLPYHLVQKAVLSPDGHYGLILTSNDTDTAHLFLVRLEDLSCRKMAGIDPMSIQFGIKDGGAYHPVIEWQGDKLLIGTDKGIRLFQFR
jgi:tetratricopeptide (TPR) repeat protein